MPVFLEDSAKDPTVTMEVGKLRVLCVRVQVGDSARETPGPTSYPCAAVSSGFDIIERVNSSADGYFCSSGTSARRRSLRPTTCNLCKS